MSKHLIFKAEPESILGKNLNYLVGDITLIIIDPASLIRYFTATNFVNVTDNFIKNQAHLFLDPTSLSRVFNL